MTGALAPDTIAELDAAGVAIAPGQDAFGALLAAAEAHGLASKVTETPRTRRRTGVACPCYRARVRPVRVRGVVGRHTIGRAARGWGENGATALARALLAWFT